MGRFATIVWLGLMLAGTGSHWLSPLAPGSALAKGPSLVIEAGSGAVLQAESPDQPWYPASLTKIMTAYLVFEALAEGRVTLDQEIEVSKEAASQAPVRLGLRAGRKIKLKDALTGAVVASANDAAVVLAEAVAGTETAFANLMTQKARALGMKRTRFVNASGLPDDAQVTTARDMAILAQALRRDFPERIALFGQRNGHAGKRRVSTTNGWLTNYRGADGLKTGFTCGSGYNLVGTAVRDGRRLLGVVLGGKTSGARNARMTKLLNEGFKTPTNGQPRLSALPPMPAENGSPKALLGPSACARSPQVAVLEKGKLPGWGVIFGAFVSKTEAKAVIDSRRKAVAPVGAKGRPAVIGRDKEGLRRFSALLVGLQQGDAGQLCKQLWDRGDYCLALSPEQLNHPKSIWR